VIVIVAVAPPKLSKMWTPFCPSMIVLAVELPWMVMLLFAPPVLLTRLTGPSAEAIT
jgi:hypothetical protein